MGIKLCRFLPFFLWLIAILVASFMPSQHIRSSWFLFPNEDKLIHFCMYFGLSFLFVWAYIKEKKTSITFLLIVALIASLFSGCIEVLQPLLSNRTSDISDFIANSFGAFLGSFFFALKSKKEL